MTDYHRTVAEILLDEGREVVEALRESFDRNDVNATGDLRRSILAEVTDLRSRLRLEVSGLDYILATEDGSPPSDRSNLPRLQRDIKTWIRAKPVPVDDVESAAWAIASEIIERGTRLWQSGGGSGVISDVIREDTVDQILDRVEAVLVEDFLTSLDATITSTDR